MASASWPPLFLGLLILSCCNTVLLGMLTATVVEFHKVSPDAAYLLLPYLGWSTFAAVLTLDIWKRNPEVPHQSMQLCCHAFALLLAPGLSTHVGAHAESVHMQSHPAHLAFCQILAKSNQRDAPAMGVNAQIQKHMLRSTTITGHITVMVRGCPCCNLWDRSISRAYKSFWQKMQTCNSIMSAHLCPICAMVGSQPPFCSGFYNV